MTAARILTVRQPWAWAIIHGGKNVENRSTNIAGDYRGPVLIHAAKAYDADWQSDVLVGLMSRHPGVYEEPQPWRDHAGEIIGVVDLVDVHLGSRNPEWCWHDDRGMKDRCSPWGEDDSFHLVFENPRALDEPIPYTGALGLRRSPFNVEDDWLLETIDRCTCGLHIAGTHEARCGIEAVARLAAIA